MDYEEVINLSPDDDSYKYEENEDETSLMEVESAILAYCNETPFATDLVNNIEKSRNFNLLGLQFVLEVRKGVYPSLGSCKYWCALCQKSLASSSLISHLSSNFHQAFYLEKVFPTLSSTAKSSSNPSTIYKQYNKQIWDAVGPAKMIVVPDVDEATVVELLNKKIKLAIYLSYYDDVTSEDQNDMYEISENKKRVKLVIEGSSKRQRGSSDYEDRNASNGILKAPNEYIGSVSSHPRVLMVGGYFDHSDIGSQTLKVARITYAVNNCKFYDHDSDGFLFLKTIEQYDLADYDLMTVTPFNWLVNSVNLEPLGINPRASGVVSNFDESVELNSKISNLLRKIKEVSMRWKKQYPNLKVLWMLPYPLNFSKRKVSRNCSTRHVTYRSIIQFSKILNIESQWRQMMPDIALLNLSDFVVRPHQRDSFFDGSLELNWDSNSVPGTFGSGLSYEIRARIWTRVLKLYEGMKIHSSKTAKTTDKMTMWDLKKFTVSSDDQAEFKSLKEEREKYMKKKSLELKLESINPEIYEAVYEWGYHWNKIAKPELMKQGVKTKTGNENNEEMNKGRDSKDDRNQDNRARGSTGNIQPLMDRSSQYGSNIPSQTVPYQNFPGPDGLNQNFNILNRPNQNFNGPNDANQSFNGPNGPNQNFNIPNGPIQNFPGPNGPNQNFNSPITGQNFLANYQQPYPVLNDQIQNHPNQNYQYGSSIANPQNQYNALNQAYPQATPPQVQTYPQPVATSYQQPSQPASISHAAPQFSQADQHGGQTFNAVYSGYSQQAGANPSLPNASYAQPAPALPSYSPLCTLNILCEAKGLLGFLGGPLLSLQQEADQLESAKRDAMVLFDKEDPVDLIKLCQAKLEKLKPENVQDAEEQFMIEPAKKLCNTLIAEINKRR